MVVDRFGTVVGKIVYISLGGLYQIQLPAGGHIKVKHDDPAYFLQRERPSVPLFAVSSTSKATAAAPSIPTVVAPPSPSASAPPLSGDDTETAWRNVDITALIGCGSKPGLVWVRSVDAPQVSTNGATKKWAVDLLWYRGLEAGGRWKFTGGTTTLHFHPSPLSLNYLHLKRNDDASPGVGVLTNTHWLIGALGISQSDVTPS